MRYDATLTAVPYSRRLQPIQVSRISGSRATTTEHSRTDDGGSLEVVADSVGVETDELAEVDLETPFIQDRAGTATSYTASGTYTVVFDRPAADANEDPASFKPIASQANRGVVKFFGTVHGRR